MSLLTTPSTRRVRPFESQCKTRRAVHRAVAAAIEPLEGRRLFSSVVVNSLLDNATDASVSGPTVTLREAVNYANASGDNTTITFAPGLTGTITLGSELILNDSGFQITVAGPGANVLAISGNDVSRLFLVDPGTTAEFDGLTLTHGNAAGQDGINGYGNSFGGAIDSLGAAIVDQCTVSDNQSLYAGGGIANVDYTPLTVVDSVITGNFVNGQGPGGGIFSQGSATVLRTFITGNTGSSGGGGIYGYQGSFTLIDSTVTGNNSSYGAGIGSVNATTFNVINSTVSGNTATVYGGGIYSAGAGPYLTLINSTIAGNSAPNGAGIVGSATLNNTILADSVYDPYNANRNITPTFTGSNNLIVAGATQGLTNGVNGNIVVASAAAMSLGTLGDNGGPTQTIALLPGSPGIDAGSNALAVDASGNPLTNDQRGSARVVGGTVDIGAYESPLLDTTTTVTDASGVYTGSPFSASGAVNVGSTFIATPTFTYYLSTDTTLSQPLLSAPANVGSYVVAASYAGQGTYQASSTSTSFNITQATPTVSVMATGGTYNAQAYIASDTVNNAASLEGVTPTLTYYAGLTAGGTPLTNAPAAAGNYTVVANFSGSADYAPASASTTFTITRATPTVTVTDNGGAYNGVAFAATDTVNNAASLEGVAPTLTYYAGSTASGTPLAAAPVAAGTYTVVANFAGSTDYATASATKTFTVAQASSVLKPAAVTAIYGGTASLSTTLTTASGAILVGRTVSFSLNGKVIGTSVSNTSGVATLNASDAGIAPGMYASGVTVSFAGDVNSTATSATASLTVTDAAIVAKGTALSLLNIALTLGTFTQARTGAVAGDFVVSVNWGDGTAAQNATVITDPLHPGQFDIVGPLHLYKKLFTAYTVTVTISTVAKFGVAGATTTFTTTIVA